MVPRERGGQPRPRRSNRAGTAGSERMGRYPETLSAAGLCLLAKGLHATGATAGALARYTETCTVARTLPTRYWLETAFNDLAEAHRGLGQLTSAHGCYAEAIEIARLCYPRFNSGWASAPVGNLSDTPRHECRR